MRLRVDSPYWSRNIYKPSLIDFSWEMLCSRAFKGAEIVLEAEPIGFHPSPPSLYVWYASKPFEPIIFASVKMIEVALQMVLHLVSAAMQG